jgi:hypothetical protein
MNTDLIVRAREYISQRREALNDKAYYNHVRYWSPFILKHQKRRKRLCDRRFNDHKKCTPKKECIAKPFLDNIEIKEYEFLDLRTQETLEDMGGVETDVEDD